MRYDTPAAGARHDGELTDKPDGQGRRARRRGHLRLGDGPPRPASVCFARVRLYWTGLTGQSH